MAMRKWLLLLLIPSLALLVGYNWHEKDINIQQVMDYPIPHVIHRYCKDYGVSKEEAKVYERELKRYLILAAKSETTDMPMTSKEVDELWHTFLLFTKEYQKFCNESFGKFVHHVPHIEEEE